MDTNTVRWREEVKRRFFYKYAVFENGSHGVWGGLSDISIRILQIPHSIPKSILQSVHIT